MKFAQLSVELGHLYISALGLEKNATKLSDFAREAINRRIDRTYAAVAPIVKRYRDAGKMVSTTILIDDYFMDPHLTAIKQQISGYVRTSCEEAEIPLDYIVYESALAVDVDRLYKRLIEFPKYGSGSAGRDTDPTMQWLDNGQPGRAVQTVAMDARLGLGADRDASDPVDRLGTAYGVRGGKHSLHVDVELYSDAPSGRIWSCPILAAWWQLVRLGMLRDSDGNPRLPPDTVPISSNSALCAKRTLTALSPEFLEIEAAVRAILTQANIPEMWLSGLREGIETPKHDEHLTRIGYTFLHDDFHVHDLRSSALWT